MSEKKMGILFVKTLVLAIGAAGIATLITWISIIATASPSEVKMVIGLALVLLVLFIISQSFEIIEFVRNLFKEIEKEVEEL